MGLKRTWVCDRCGKTKEVDPHELPAEDRPPHGWQTIAFPRGPSVVYVLLCHSCMGYLYDQFIAKKGPATGE